MKRINILSSIAFSACCALHSFAQTWVQTGAPSNSWHSVACSADGTKIVAAAGDAIYFSTNSGSTWTSNSASMAAIALSADGNKWAAVNLGTYVYTSTNWGMTWKSVNTPTQEFYFDFQLDAVASSADGNKLIVGPNIYSSRDSGATWTPSNTNRAGDSLACSSDGTKLFAINVGGISISTNSGDTWFTNNAPPFSFSVGSIASSADGNKLAILANSYGIYVSTDMGASWTKTVDVSGGGPGSPIVSSAEGSRLLAAVGPVLYVSADSGATWTTNNPEGPFKGKHVAMSADGTELIAAVYGGGIWMLRNTPAPQLNLAFADDNLNLSWTVPSTNFVLQSSADLLSWTDVTNQPVLNLTNLQDEVYLAPTNDSIFFRLKTP